MEGVDKLCVHINIDRDVKCALVECFIMAYMVKKKTTKFTKGPFGNQCILRNHSLLPFSHTSLSFSLASAVHPVHSGGYRLFISV